MDWHWFLKTLMKSSLLAGSAIILLAFWTKRGIQSRTFYRLSWANPISHLLWLALIAILGYLNASGKVRGWMPSSLAGSLFFAFPFLFAFCSLILCFAAIFLKPGQRGFAVCVNALMLALWLSVTAAPN